MLESKAINFEVLIERKQIKALQILISEYPQKDTKYLV